MLEIFSYLFSSVSSVHEWYICAFDHRHRSHLQAPELFQMVWTVAQNGIQSFLIVATSLTNTLWTFAHRQCLLFHSFSLSNYIYIFANYLLLCESFLPKWLLDANQNKYKPRRSQHRHSISHYTFDVCVIFDQFYGQIQCYVLMDVQRSLLIAVHHNGPTRFSFDANRQFIERKMSTHSH